MSLLKYKNSSGSWQNIPVLSGKDGENGATPNITFSVETLDTSESVKVTQGGTTDAPTVKIGIPRGTNANTDSIVKKSGNRGELSGYQSINVASSDITINQDSNDETIVTTASNITVDDGNANTAWTKTITIANKDSVVTLGEAWAWSGGNAPTLTPNSVLVCHWCNDIGIAKVIEGAMGKIVSVGGRTLYRHESGMGTVMEFNDGQDRKVLVLDAKYRAKELALGLDGNYPSIHNCITSNTNGNQFIDGIYLVPSELSPGSCASLTDESLNSLWANSIDINTSKYNTDILLSIDDTDTDGHDSEAATYCRSITVNGVGCDIPNIQTLMRIYCEAILLDEFDPTVSLYPDLKLSDWLNASLLWSSTEAEGSYGLGLLEWGMAHGDRKTYAYGVCPVLEL